jgi:CRP-like cAMP-binding protein
LHAAFPTVPQNILIRLSYNFIKKEYTYGEYVYHQGDQPDCFYLIISGEVSIEVSINIDLNKSKQGVERLL